MRNFIDIFEDHAKRHPDNIAVKFYAGSYCSLTFAELNARVNQLAHHITQKYHLAPGSCIGILRERSLDTLMMMLVAWKLNCSFILLDPQQIKTHRYILKFYLKKCQVALIATQNKEDEFRFIQEVKVNALYLNDPITLEKISEENPSRENIDGMIAYYIPTSGSSGDPKICTILQGNGLTDLCVDIGAKLNLGRGDTALWNTPLGFDPVIAVPGWAFSRAAAIYISDSEEAHDPELVMQRYETHNVNVMVALPTLIPKLMEHENTLKRIKNLRILSTGEALTLDHVKTLAKVAEVWNGYGPTETPIGITLTRNKPNDPAINIGEPIKGRVFKIINPLTGKEQSEGKEGELCYRCEGFGGYLGDPEQTAKRKVIINGEEWWRSGDYVCWEVKDQFRYLAFRGRKDDQIKISSVRMQLGGIESILSRHEAVTLVRTVYFEPNKKSKLGRIISFCETNDKNLSSEELNFYLRTHIYRIIRHSVVTLDPNDQLSKHHTANGKLDKNKLFAKYRQKIVNSENISLEEKLLAIWRDLLGVQDIERDSDFRNLGGTSMDFVALEALVAEDESIKIRAFSSSFEREFKINPSFNNFLALVTLHHNRAKRIQRFHQERKARPLFFFGESSAEELSLLSNTHPIIQINLTSPLRGEDLEELDNILQICDPHGPYLFCANSLHLDWLRVFAEKIEKTHRQVLFSGTIDAPNFSSTLAEAYHRFLSDRVEENIRKICASAAPRKIEMAALPRLSEAFCIFGAASTGKTSLALQLAQQATPYLPIHIEKMKNPHFSIETALIHLGFTDEQTPIVIKKPILLIIDGITRLEEIEGLFEQKLFLACANLRCVFTVNPSLLPKEKFIDLIKTQFKNCETETLSRNYFFENRSVADIPAWFSRLVEEEQINAREAEKARLYDRLFHYAVSLAQLMGDSESLSLSKVPNVWEDETARKEPTQRLLDIQDKLTHQALLACPVSIEKDRIRFISSELKLFFLQYNLKEKNWPSPYGQENSFVTENLLFLQLKQVVEIYNEQKGSGSQPLFFFPPITGQEVLAPLIQQFPENQLIYSFRHPVWTEIGGEYQSIIELADFYIKFIILLCPNGPIALAGWSFGGTLCNEIAKKLIALGREINYLGIIDSPATSFYQSLLKDSTQHAALLRSRLEWLIETYKLNGKYEFSQINGPEEADRMFADLEAQNQNQKDEIKILINICRKHYAQLLAYKSDDRLIPVAKLYQATESNPFYPRIEVSALGWALDETQVRFIGKCDHFSLTQGEAAKELAEKIQEDYERSWQEKSGLYFDARIAALVRGTLQNVQALSPENYIPLTLKGSGLDEENIDEFWRQLLERGSSDNYLLLGEAGSGKSCSARKLFSLLAEAYLRSPQDQAIPIYIRLSDFKQDAIKNYLSLSGLNRAEEIYFLSQSPVFILDGIDEVDYDAFLQTLEFLNKSKASRCIFTCKLNYFEHHPSLDNFLKREFKVKSIYLQPLDQAQQEALLADKSVNLEWLRGNVGNGDPITPTLLKLIVGFNSNIKLRRAHLYERWLQSQAKKTSLDSNLLYRFAKALAIVNFGLSQPSSKTKFYPWEEAHTDLSQLLAQPRYDTDKFILALNLQVTINGLDFNHRSFLDYFMARVIFEQIMDKKTPIENWYITKFSLCYEHDLLSFINDIYQDFLFLEPNETDIRRKFFQRRIHEAVTSAKNNPENKLLAANALSILTACKDFKLSFPKDYKNVFLGDVNFSDGNLSNLDFTGVISENAILIGAVTNYTKLPSAWLRTKVSKAQRIHNLFLQTDGSLWGTYETNVKSWEVSDWVRVCVNDPSRPSRPIPKLRIHSEIENHPANIIETVICHSDSEHYAVLTNYPDKSYRSTERDQLNMRGLCHLQVFSQKGMIADYIFDYSEKPRDLTFHATKIILFALNNKCSDLLIYDPEHNEPIKIPYINSTLKRFSCNSSFLASASQFGDEKIQETKGIVILGLNDSYQRHFIPLNKITGEKSDGSITALAVFPIHPVVAVAINQGQKNSIYIYHLSKERVITHISVGSVNVSELEVDKDGDFILYAVRKFVYYWHISTNKVLVLFESLMENPRLFFHQDFFILNRMSSLNILPGQTIKEIKKERSGHKYGVGKLIQHPHFPVIVSLSIEKIILWDSRNGELLGKIEPTEKFQVESACFSPDGKYFFLGVRMSIWIYSFESFTLKLLTILPGRTLIQFQRIKSQDGHPDEEYHERIEYIQIDPRDSDFLIISTDALFPNRREHELFRWNWKNGELEEIEHRTWKGLSGKPETKCSITCISASHASGEIWLAQNTKPPRFHLLNQNEFTVLPKETEPHRNQQHYPIRYLHSSQSGHLILVICGNCAFTDLRLFSRTEGTQLKLLCRLEHAPAAVFSSDERYLAVLETDSYSTEKTKSFVKIWDTQLFLENPACLPLITIPVFGGKLSYELLWTREDNLFFGTNEGDLFCYDMGPLNKNRTPKLKWCSAQDIQYSCSTIPSGRFFKPFINNKRKSIIKYDISPEEALQLIKCTNNEALSLLKNRLFEIRDMLQPIVLKALEEKNFIKNDCVFKYRLFSPHNANGYSHNLNTQMDYLEIEFSEKNCHSGWLHPGVFLILAGLKGAAVQFWKEDGERLECLTGKLADENSAIHLLILPNGAYLRLDFNHPATKTPSLK